MWPNPQETGDVVTFTEFLLTQIPLGKKGNLPYNEKDLR